MGFVNHLSSIVQMVIIWDICIIGAAIWENETYIGIIRNLFKISDSQSITPIIQIGTSLLVLIIADFIMVTIAFPIMMRLDNFDRGFNKQLKSLTAFGVPALFIFSTFFWIFYD